MAFIPTMYVYTTKDVWNVHICVGRVHYSSYIGWMHICAHHQQLCMHALIYTTPLSSQLYTEYVIWTREKYHITKDDHLLCYNIRQTQINSSVGQYVPHKFGFSTPSLLKFVLRQIWDLFINKLANVKFHLSWPSI